MSHKTYMSLVGVIFLIIVVVHLLRVVGGWSIVINNWSVPVWVSWIGLLAGGFLSFKAFKLQS